MPSEEDPSDPDSEPEETWAAEQLPTLPASGGNEAQHDATLSLGATPGNTPNTRSGSAEPGRPADVVSVRYFGDYELLEEIARGGMGVVFKARQVSLNRIVALKMILAGQFAGEKDVLRFRTEAESAAQLDHPGIVPIFEIGEHDDLNYFSMGYVEGESLAARVADGPLAPRDAAMLLEKISEAMAYAHGRGVIHRDLKPANVLIDPQGQPKITDFGLAKKTEADSDLTGTGQILGTPAYMPPEQAGGKVDEVGPLADVYSLGAILYCLLTGRPPFQAANPMDALRQVLERDPIPARQLVPSIPRDLETICGKCLSKDPVKRYESASDLSADLQRYLDDQPILARPAGRIERASKWASKQPAIAAILLTLPAWLLGEPKIGVGLLALIAGFHLPFRFRVIRLLSVLVVALMATGTLAGLGLAFAFADGEVPGGARIAAISLLSAAAPLGIVLFVFIFDCVSELHQPNRRRARWLLLASAFLSLVCIAGFLYYLRSHSEQISLIVAQLTAEIKTLTSSIPSTASETTSSDAMMQLFRSRTVLWMPVYTAIVWLNLGLGIIIARLIRRFVYATDDSIKGAERHHPMRLVKNVDGDVSRWVAIFAAVTVSILPYIVSSVLGIYNIRLMQAFDLGNPLGFPLWSIVAAWLAAYAVISRRQFLIASAVGACLFVFIVALTAQAIDDNLRRLEPEFKTAVAPIPVDDSMLLKLEGHTGPVKCVDVSSDGKLAASASGWPKGDGTVRVWNLETGKLLWLRQPGPPRMMSVGFTLDAKRIVGGSSDGAVFVWDVETARQLHRFQATADVEGLRLIDDDKLCVAAGNKVQLWDLQTIQLVREFEGSTGRQLDVSVSDDGKRIASGAMDGTVHVWELESGKEINHVTDLSGQVESVALDQEGARVLVALNQDPFLLSINVEDPSDRRVIEGHSATVNWVRYSADRRFFITASRDKSIRVWDVATGSEIQSLRGHRDWVWSAVITHDGQRILSGGGGASAVDMGSDWSVRLWDTSKTLPKPED